MVALTLRWVHVSDGTFTDVFFFSQTVKLILQSYLSYESRLQMIANDAQICGLTDWDGLVSILQLAEIY